MVGAFHSGALPWISDAFCRKPSRSRRAGVGDGGMGEIRKHLLPEGEGRRCLVLRDEGLRHLIYLSEAVTRPVGADADKVSIPESSSMPRI